MTTELDDLRRQISVLERDVWGARDYALTVADELSELRRENRVLEHQYSAVLEHLQGLEKIRDHQMAMYSSLTWRLGNTLLRPFAPFRNRLRRDPSAGENAVGSTR